jgi:hypothetical protein
MSETRNPEWLPAELGERLRALGERLGEFRRRL